MASLCSSVTGVCVLQQHLGPGTRPPAINTSLQHNLMSRNIMNSELFWQTQSFHIITGAPYCEGILGSGMSTISISTHYYLHIVIYPTLRIYKLIFFDTRETCSMLHALVTINEESLVPQFLTLKLLFISFIGMSYRYLHQYKHNIDIYWSINTVSGVGLTARDCGGPAPRHHRSRSWGPLVTAHTFTDNCPWFQISS